MCTISAMLETNLHFGKHFSFFKTKLHKQNTFTKDIVYHGLYPLKKKKIVHTSSKIPLIGSAKLHKMDKTSFSFHKIVCGKKKKNLWLCGRFYFLVRFDWQYWQEKEKNPHNFHQILFQMLLNSDSSTDESA